jgi:hypothetical protein
MNKMRWWIYKCNSLNQPHQQAYGDWADFFDHWREDQWGSTEWIPALKKLTVGDMIIAYQSDRNELVGLARVARTSNEKDAHIYLEPLERMAVKIRPLKRSDPRIANIPALQPGPIKTIYEISDSDASRLLKVAGATYALKTKSTSAHEMKVWRMSFRCGDRGYEIWPHCLELGVAAITYSPLAKVDLSKYHPGEPKHLWSKLAPSQQASLRKVAYEMKEGDIIYVKQGPRIVSRGKVVGPYRFDSEFRLRCPDSKIPWSHQVPVNWEFDFQPIDMLLGSEPSTVLLLSGDRLQRLEQSIDETHKVSDKQDALEGEKFKAETTFRKRSRALIEAKKANSDGRCEACGFSFGERYGEIGRDCLVAHHINAIAGRSTASKKTLDDIVLLCPNCHAVIHSSEVPISLDNLKSMLRK